MTFDLPPPYYSLITTVLANDSNSLLMKLVTSCFMSLFWNKHFRVHACQLPRAECCFRRLPHSVIFTDTWEECGVAAKGLKYSSSLDNYRNYGNLWWNDGFLPFRMPNVSWTWVHFKSTETQQISCTPTQYGNEHSFGSGDEPVGLSSHCCSSERSSTIRNAWRTVCPMPGDSVGMEVHISPEGWIIRVLGNQPLLHNTA